MIKPTHRDRVFKALINSLLPGTSDAKVVGSNLFLIVDFINRIGQNGTMAAGVRTQYAELNLEAGIRAMDATDFVSAVKYLEAGLSFLDGDNWKEHYQLSLQLFQNAALALSTTGNFDLMVKRTNTVFAEALCFEDKIDSYNILIKSLSLRSIRNETFEKGFFVLEQLGETFPSIVDRDVGVKEVLEVKASLQNISIESIADFPRMTDHLRLAGMVS